MPIDFPNPQVSTTFTDTTTGNTYTFANGSWSIANLLPVSKGGTGFASFARGDILFGNSTGTLSKLAASTSGYVLSTNGTGADPTWIAMSGGGQTIASASDGQIAFYSGAGSSIKGRSGFTVSDSTGAVAIDMTDTDYAFHIRGSANESRFRFSTDGAMLHLNPGTGKTAEIRLYINNNGYYTGIKANLSAAGSVTYTLPSNKPSTGTSVLQSDDSGNLSWVAMSASTGGGAGTVATPGTQYQLAGYYAGGGASVSGSSTFTNNTSTGIVSITHSTGSTSPAFGALLVSGGVGIAGTLSYYKSQVGVAGTTSIPSVAFIGNTNNPVYLNVLENNSLSFEGSQGQLLSISPDLNTGYVFTVGDISGIPLLRANANANVTANEFGGNFGIGTTNPGYRLEVSGQTAITGSTSSTSTSTGALIVTGGVGIGGSLNVNSLSKFSNHLEIRSGNELRLYRSADTNYTALKSALVTASKTFTLPLDYGSAGQFLYTTDASGTLDWRSDPVQVNSGTINQIAYYAAAGNTVSGSSTFTNDTSGGIVSITHVTSSTGFSTGALVVTGGVGVGGSLRIGDTSGSTSTTTGALTVRGGVGIGGTLYVGAGFATTASAAGDLVVTGGAGIGGTLRVSGTTDAGSSASGSLVVAGGMGVAKNLYVGSLLSVSSTTNLFGATSFLNELSTATFQNRIIKSGSIALSMSAAGASGAVFQIWNANIKETGIGTGSSVATIMPAISFRKQTFSATNASITYTRAANVYIEDAPDSSVTGAVGSGGTNTVTILNSYALYVDQGKTLLGGPILAGGNTYAKSLGNGDIALDNGTSDTPGLLMYWGNNKNISIDTYYSGTGTTKLRIVKELNESGGGELWSVDRNGIVTQTAWAAGETIKTQTYNYSELSMSVTDPVSITSGTYTTIATASYTPLSSSSYLWIEFSATYDYNNGTAADEFAANIEVGGTEIINVFQKFVNGSGGGTRSGVLFPLSGRYTNSGTSALSITVRVKRNSGDDPIRVFGNSGSGLMRIQEIGR